MRRAGAPLFALLLCAGVLAGCSDSGKAKVANDTDPALTPESVRFSPKEKQRAKRSNAKVVQIQGAGAQLAQASPTADAPSPGAPSDAQVKADLKEARASLRSFKMHLANGATLQEGPQAKVLKDGTAQAPRDAPDAVKRVILAGNEIARFPYKWGGGHGAWRDNGYDCSGSVSFALAGAGFLKAPMTSGGFMSWGDEGPGDWITIYANGGHIFMFVAGLRFDTSGRGRDGTRWQDAGRSVSGFAVRHPPGY